ncbi:MAG: YHS domain-containing protein [Deltaproteobacteria bacterium]|nr:YHS domain-containing protein [Deltaproteobacteria bacterium]
MKIMASILFLVICVFFCSNLSYSEEAGKSQDINEETKVTTKDQNQQRREKEENKSINTHIYGFDKKPLEGTDAICPVTKEKFRIGKKSAYSKYKGRYYYFCCDGCRPVFEKEPEKYLKE